MNDPLSVSAMIELINLVLAAFAVGFALGQRNRP